MSEAAWEWMLSELVTHVRLEKARKNLAPLPAALQTSLMLPRLLIKVRS